MPNGRPDEERLRTLVAAEVTAQMKPVAEMLKAVHEWQLSFWSNGSGRPPGFFQSRMLADDVRNAQTKEELKAATSLAEAAAANAAKVAVYINKKQILEEHRAEQWKRVWAFVKWVGPSVGAAFLGLCVWLGPRIVKVGDILVQDYLKYHPAVSEQLKTVSSDPVPAVQSVQQTGLPERVEPIPPK